MKTESSDLLRAAYQIAVRRGEDTNWEAFETSLRNHLLLIQGAVVMEADEQTIQRATCTARTYRATHSGIGGENGYTEIRE